MGSAPTAFVWMGTAVTLGAQGPVSRVLGPILGCLMVLVATSRVIRTPTVSVAIQGRAVVAKTAFVMGWEHAIPTMMGRSARRIAVMERT